MDTSSAPDIRRRPHRAPSGRPAARDLGKEKIEIKPFGNFFQERALLGEVNRPGFSGGYLV
jgi:hypothetical protein